MKAELIEHMGSDLTVVNAARVSFSKESERFVGLSGGLDEGDYQLNRKLGPKDKKLIAYLAKHNHWTPFSHPQIMMREKVPIFVARQRFKHMVGFTYNEVSRRYVDDEPEFFTPDIWRSRPEGSVKQGSGSEEVSRIKYTQRDGYGDVLSFKPETKEVYEDLILTCEQVYSAMLRSGVAPEQARMVLPQSMYTEYYVTGSLSAWARAYKQRIDAHAQVEIQDLARSWDEIIRPLFPESWSALVDGS